MAQQPARNPFGGSEIAPAPSNPFASPSRQQRRSAPASSGPPSHLSSEFDPFGGPAPQAPPPRRRGSSSAEDAGFDPFHPTPTPTPGQAKRPMSNPSHTIPGLAAAATPATEPQRNPVPPARAMPRKSFDPFADEAPSPTLAANPFGDELAASPAAPPGGPVVQTASSQAQLQSYLSAPLVATAPGAAPPPPPALASFGDSPAAPASPQQHRFSAPNATIEPLPGGAAAAPTFAGSDILGQVPVVDPFVPSAAADDGFGVAAVHAFGEASTASSAGETDEMFSAAEMAERRRSATEELVRGRRGQSVDVWDGDSDAPMQRPSSLATVEDGVAKGEEEEDGAKNLELQAPPTTNTYDITFENESKLGMVLEKDDEWERGSEYRKERTVVRMILEGGAADTRGVKLGSKVLALNGQDVTRKTYVETLDLVRTLPRPLTMRFESFGTIKDASQGWVLTRKAPGYYAPQALGSWSKQFFVLGGTVARHNILQVYDSKGDYEQVVVRMFSSQSIHDIKLKAYKLTLSYKCGAIKEKWYNHGRTLIKYFWLKNPQSKTKVMKFGSENASEIVALYNQVRKFTTSA